MNQSNENNKKMEPDLRFRGFNEDWVEGSLESITKKKISYGIVQAGPNISNGMPYIKSMDLNSELCIDGLERTSSEIAEKYKRSEVNPGDIVFSLRGNIGVSQVLPQTIPIANLTQGTARISIKNHFSETYFKHLLDTKNVLKKVLAVSKGSTFQEISLTDLRKLKIRFSENLKEQQKIANFLTAIDQRITLLKQKKAALEQYKKGLMQKIFSQEIRFLDDEGNDFPDWEEKRLGEVGDIVTGKTPKSNDKSLWENELDFVTPSDILEGSKYQYSVMRRVSKLKNMRVLPAGSILYTCIASIGKMSLSVNECITNQQINSLIPKEEFVNEFIYYSLLYKTPRIKALQANTTLPIINKTEFSKIKIKIPSPDEQQKIADCLSAIDQSIHQLTNQIDQTTQFHKGLLQRMFV